MLLVSTMMKEHKYRILSRKPNLSDLHDDKSIDALDAVGLPN